MWELEWRSNGIVISWIAARTALLGALFSVVCLACVIGLLRTKRPLYGILTLLSAAAALASYK